MSPENRARAIMVANLERSFSDFSSLVGSGQIFKVGSPDFVRRNPSAERAAAEAPKML
jgi:hypothetical protein